MANVIQIKRKTTSGSPALGVLSDGEFVLNIADSKLHLRLDGTTLLTWQVESDLLNNTALTGVPTAPTAGASTNTVQIATTAFVQQEMAGAGAGDMLASVYDSAAISEQLVGLVATQTLSNKTLTSPVINSTISGTAFLDEDDMTSDAADKVASQQSIKAYVTAQIASAVTNGMNYKGAYNASTNTPALDTGSPSIEIGDVYAVTVAGTFFTVALEVGDMIIANNTSSDVAVVGDWDIIQANLTAASIKTQYESNSDTNALTDAMVTLLGNTSNTNSGDEPNASTTVKGVVEEATQAEQDAGTAAGATARLFVNPATLKVALDLKYDSASTIDGGTIT